MTLINRIKQIVRPLILGYRSTNESYLKHLRKVGCNIGEGTHIYQSQDVLIDESRPWLISIGKNVQITRGVNILTHGYDWSVLKGLYGEVLGSSGGGFNRR